MFGTSLIFVLNSLNKLGTRSFTFSKSSSSLGSGNSRIVPTLPKGHVDPGESDYETALRETEEEAGFNAEVLRVIPDFKVEVKYNVTSRRDGINRPKIVTYWLAELKNSKENEVKMSDEHQAFKWLSLNEAVELCSEQGFKDMSQAFQHCHDKIEELK